LFPFNDEILVI